MDEKSTAKLFGEHLRKIRLEKRMSQEKLAHQSGYHPTYISHLETGKKQPTLQTIIQIAKSLDVKLADLLSPFE